MFLKNFHTYIMKLQTNHYNTIPNIKKFGNIITNIFWIQEKPSIWQIFMDRPDVSNPYVFFVELYVYGAYFLINHSPHYITFNERENKNAFFDKNKNKNFDWFF